MDALAYAIEANIGRSGNKKICDDALEASKLILNNIYNAYAKNDRKSRKNMLYASYLAWHAFSKAYVGYVHALSHALSGKYKFPHEYTNAIKQMAFYDNKEANPLYPVPELWSYRKLVKIYSKIGKIDYNETMA